MEEKSDDDFCELNEETAARLGCGNTNVYYRKWNAIAEEEFNRTVQEEEEQKAECDEVLGKKKPQSKAEEDSLSKHEALKEAKRALQKQKDREESIVLKIENEKQIGVREIDQLSLNSCRVILIKNCEESHFIFPIGILGLIKIFVEDCTNVQVDVLCGLVTRTIEISHSEACTITFLSFVGTIQADLCQNLKLKISQQILASSQDITNGHPVEERFETKVYWAGCHNLQVEYGDFFLQTNDYIDLTNQTGGLLNSSCYEEVQYVVQMVNGVLLNERVVRTPVSNLPSTERELRAESLLLSRNEQLQQQTETLKDKGGFHFTAGEYAQAAVEYTKALESGVLHKYDNMHILYANRAFCFSKLGQHEHALKDAELATSIAPSYTKGWFRKGISLHALGRYREACAALGKGLDLEPGNKQIKDALRFAEMRLRTTLVST